MAETKDVKVQGEVITLGSEEYVLPPLPLIKMSSIKRLMSGGDFTEDEEYVGSLVDAIYWSLKRNYPQMDRETVELNLDMANFQAVMDAFMKTNKMTPKAGAPATGEATAS